METFFRNLVAAAFLFCWVYSSEAAPGDITTVAGSGDIGSFAGSFSGDSGQATLAGMDGPLGVTVDATGNIYLADTGNERIRKVDAQTGDITTIAGNGESPGLSDDGGQATQAGLFLPGGIFLDSAGNLYIADTSNQRIRKVAPNGIITTVAGKGLTSSFEGSFSGDGGQAILAGLNEPRGVYVDGTGNIFIADEANNRIRKVDPTGVISTVAGSGSTGFFTGSYSGDGGQATVAGLNEPRGVFGDANGNLYIADTGNDRIRKVDGQTGIITTVVGKADFGTPLGDGGPATEAGLSSPHGTFVDSAGNLYIADSYNNRIRKVDAQTSIITTIAGSDDPGSFIGSFSGDGEPATQAQLNYPTGIFIDSRNDLYIADTDNHRIRKVENISQSLTPDTSQDDTTGTQPIYAVDGVQSISIDESQSGAMTMIGEQDIFLLVIDGAIDATFTLEPEFLFFIDLDLYRGDDISDITPANLLVSEDFDFGNKTLEQSLEAGSYLLFITPSVTGQTGTYTLQITGDVGGTPTVPDNTEELQAISLGEPQSGTLATPDQRGIFLLFVEGGTEATFTVDPDFDAVLGLYRGQDLTDITDENRIASIDDSYGTESFDQTIDPGAYLIVITSFEGKESGAYTLEVRYLRQSRRLEMRVNRSKRLKTICHLKVAST